MYLESYTSILCYGLDKSQLEEFYGREVIDADRTCVEQQSGEEERGEGDGKESDGHFRCDSGECS